MAAVARHPIIIIQMAIVERVESHSRPLRRPHRRAQFVRACPSNRMRRLDRRIDVAIHLCPELLI